MTTSELPENLASLNADYLSLRKPVEPFLEDRVKDSEIAEGGFTSLVGAILAYTILPWWADGAVEGDLEGGWQDYAIGFGGTLVGVATYTSISGLPWWEIFSKSVLAAAFSLLIIFVLHMILRKCVSMVIYNRVFRRKWMVSTRAEDSRKYQNDCDTYPARLQAYQEAKVSKEAEVQRALLTHNAGNPEKQYMFSTRGIVPVSNAKSLFDLAGNKAKATLGRFFTR
jgi:hypothetical protein